VLRLTVSDLAELGEDVFEVLGGDAEAGVAHCNDDLSVHSEKAAVAQRPSNVSPRPAAVEPSGVGVARGLVPLEWLLPRSGHSTCVLLQNFT
jgi:hypothetical protein